MALTDNITKEYKDELMKNKTPENVTTTIMGLTTDTVHKSNNINDGIHGDIVQNFMWPQNRNMWHLKRKNNELFHRAGSRHSFYYGDIPSGINSIKIFNCITLSYLHYF